MTDSVELNLPGHADNCYLLSGLDDTLRVVDESR